MSLDAAYEGEDVPLRVVFTDDTGAAVAPGGASGGSGPTVTVTSPNGTDVVSATVMTEVETGTYEYVWDTASNFDGTGTYSVEVTGEFSSETKIVKDTINIS